MKLSQGNVTILETCPRQFQHQVLEQLGVPQLGELWEGLQLGSQFHQLMQQRAQGLPIASIVAGNRDLSRWFQAVEDYADVLFPQTSIEPVWTESEHVRTLAWMNHTIVGVFDYLVLYPNAAQILDWKTYPKPMDPRSIQNSWQSRLYPFLLAQTTDYPPDAIEMRYWFFQGKRKSKAKPDSELDSIPDSILNSKPDSKPDPKMGAEHEPQLLRLPYSQEQQAKTAQDLTRILTSFDQWLHNYEQYGQDFPQTEQRSTCQTCAFAVRCDRTGDHRDPDHIGAIGPERSEGIEAPLTWDMVEEIAIGPFTPPV